MLTCLNTGKNKDQHFKLISLTTGYITFEHFCKKWCRVFVEEIHDSSVGRELLAVMETES
jgi:hypothetical protein